MFQGHSKCSLDRQWLSRPSSTTDRAEQCRSGNRIKAGRPAGRENLAVKEHSAITTEVGRVGSSEEIGEGQSHSQEQGQGGKRDKRAP